MTDSMEVLYRGFDGLDVAFQGALPKDLLEELETAKQIASQTMRHVLVERGMAAMHVAETGAKGGYAFRCDTGPDGATWFFKNNTKHSEWNIRVSVKSLSLALYGLGGVRARLYEFLEALGTDLVEGGESIGRVDYAVDVLAPGFKLIPDNFVMHSRTTRADHHDREPFQVRGTSGQVSSVTVGKMPGRQVIVYDKRREVVQKQKVEWWEIWNAARRGAGKAELDPEDRDGCRVWRVELRAGKKHLKDDWGITKWRDLDDKLGDLFKWALDKVRYVVPDNDSNRSRWGDHPLWDLVRRELTGDLFEMASGAEPGAVREVRRNQLIETLGGQIIGLSATLSVASGLAYGDRRAVEKLVTQILADFLDNESKKFWLKTQRAEDRYHFVCDEMPMQTLARPDYLPEDSPERDIPF